MRYLPFVLLIFLVNACKTPKLAVVKVDDQFGCIDKKGNMVIPPVWDYLLQGEKNRQILVRKNGLYGFINAKGEILISPRYPDADLFSDGLAAVNNGEKYGFINTKGDTVIPFIYDEVFMGFSHGLSDVTLQDSCGYIDREGHIVIPLRYEFCDIFTGKYAHVDTFDGKELLIDPRKKTYKYYDEIKHSKGLWGGKSPYSIRFSTPTGRGRLTAKGDTLIPPLYKATGWLSDGMYLVQDQQEKWGAYSQKGKLIISPQFDQMDHFQEGLSNFKLHEKWGYITKKGEIVVQPVFDYAGPFKNGIAYAEYEGKAGFINKRGKFVIPPTFQPDRRKGNFE